jgi:hypothetical protein
MQAGEREMERITFQDQRKKALHDTGKVFRHRKDSGKAKPLQKARGHSRRK